MLRPAREIQIKPDVALAMMRDEREETEDINGTFYLVGHRPGEPPAMVIVPCIETPAVTALLIPRLAAAENMIIDSVAMVMDTYRYLDFERPSDDADLGALFRAGDPRVGEAIVAACVDKDGPGWYVTQSYLSFEGGVIWGDVEDISQNATVGGLVDGDQEHWRNIRRELEGLLR